MSSVAPSPPEQGQLVNIRSRQWIVTDVSTSTLPPPVLDLDAVRWGAASTADVKNIQAPFRSGIGIEDDLSRLFAFEEPPLGLRAMRVVANDAAQGERFMIPQNMQVPASSVIRSLFRADGERDAANREDVGNWSDSKGKWRGVRWRWRPAKWPTGLSPSCNRSSRCELSGTPPVPVAVLGVKSPGEGTGYSRRRVGWQDAGENRSSAIC